MKYLSRIFGLVVITVLGFATYDLLTRLPTPKYHPDTDPLWLSEWALLSTDGERLFPNDRVTPYDLKVMLFSDYAQKLRTVWTPEKAAPGVRLADGRFDMPTGTILSKTFYYERQGDALLKTPAVHHGLDSRLFDLEKVRLIETRLLVKRAGGWVPLSYVWEEDQSDARLTKIGKILPLTLLDEGVETSFAYVVPDINQCGGCHARNTKTKAIEPLGFRAVHLDKPFQYRRDFAFNQLTYLAKGGVLEAAVGDDESAYEPRDDYRYRLKPRDARLYLDINCAHCHNPEGPADTSGLDLSHDAVLDARFGLCKLPIAAGAGTGGRGYDIVPGKPDDSILLYRMESVKPGAMMPELGRALRHDEGIALIRDWVAGLEGSCSPTASVGVETHAP